MAEAELTERPRRPLALWVGRGLAAAAAVIAVAFGSYFALTLPYAGFETNISSGGLAYRALRELLGDSPAAEIGRAHV